MKMEVATLTPTEQRILLLFEPDGDGPSPEDEEVDAYLQAHHLEPKRLYRETRDGKEYLVFYFGRCYLEDHVEHLATMATEADLGSWAASRPANSPEHSAD